MARGFHAGTCVPARRGTWFVTGRTDRTGGILGYYLSEYDAAMAADAFRERGGTVTVCPGINGIALSNDVISLAFGEVRQSLKSPEVVHEISDALGYYRSEGLLARVLAKHRNMRIINIGGTLYGLCSFSNKPGSVALFGLHFKTIAIRRRVHLADIVESHEHMAWSNTRDRFLTNKGVCSKVMVENPDWFFATAGGKNLWTDLESMLQDIEISRNA